MPLDSSTSYKTSFSIPQYFVSLVKEDDSFFYFDVIFKFLQSEIYNKSLRKVIIKVIVPDVSTNEYSGEKQKRSIVDTSVVSNDLSTGLSMINEVLTSAVNQIAYSKLEKQRVVLKKEIDLQSYVKGEAIQDFKSKKSVENIDSLYSFVDSLEIDKDQVEYESSNLNSNDIRSINLKLLSQFLTDPSDVVSKSQNFQGQVKKISDDLKNFYLSNALSSLQKEKVYYKSVKKRKLKDEVLIKANLALTKKLVEYSKVKIIFEIYDSKKEEPIQVEEKFIDVIKHVSYFKIQNTQPSISYFNGFLSLFKNSLFDSYVIKSKEINNIAYSTKYSDFLNGTFDKNKKNEIISRASQKVNNKLVIYRCIHKESSSNIVNPFFKNIVVGNPLDIDSTGLILEPQKNSDYVSVMVINPPYYASQFKIMRRLKLAGDAFGEPVAICKFTDIKGASTTVYDITAKKMQVYEYVVHYKTNDGLIKQSVSMLYKHIPSITFMQEVSTAMTVENSVKGNQPSSGDIQIKITSTTSEITKQSIRNIFRVNDVIEEYTNELAQQIDQVKNVFYYKVNRLNLKTGERATLEMPTQPGVGTTDIVFYDQRMENSPSGVDFTTSYKYETVVCARPPASLLRNKVITVRGSQVGKSGKLKSYSYSPYKWKQSVTSSEGMIPAFSENGELLTRSSLDGAEIAIAATYTLSSANVLQGITDLYLERIDLNKVKIQWNITDEISLYDHFVVVKESSKKRKLLGAVFSQNFVDVLENDDRGTVIYYVIPVLKDYSVFKAEKTNALIIDPEEFM